MPRWPRTRTAQVLAQIKEHKQASQKIFEQQQAANRELFKIRSRLAESQEFKAGADAMRAANAAIDDAAKADPNVTQVAQKLAEGARRSMRRSRNSPRSRPSTPPRRLATMR